MHGGLIFLSNLCMLLRISLELISNKVVDALSRRVIFLFVLKIGIIEFEFLKELYSIEW